MFSNRNFRDLYDKVADQPLWKKVVIGTLGLGALVGLGSQAYSVTNNNLNDDCDRLTLDSKFIWNVINSGSIDSYTCTWGANCFDASNNTYLSFPLSSQEDARKRALLFLQDNPLLQTTSNNPHGFYQKLRRQQDQAISDVEMANSVFAQSNVARKLRS